MLLSLLVIALMALYVSSISILQEDLFMPFFMHLQYRPDNDCISPITARGQQTLVTWATPKLSEDKVKQCVDAKLNGEYPPKIVAKVLKMVISVENNASNSSVLGGRAKECEEGFEDPESKGKESFKELESGRMKAKLFGFSERNEKLEKLFSLY
ncbi:hypothetical protein Patl1_12116 [Pistacia atlantica]|uniref:Uncharacterized protein n=1 Tax=Pistacia atlantica TaxID=434234 RepID=A0ACC1A234_9ROSI|nr:hypothetical protein Patl1_12116 [Pistacia atlantica]